MGAGYAGSGCIVGPQGKDQGRMPEHSEVAMQHSTDIMGKTTESPEKQRNVPAGRFERRTLSPGTLTEQILNAGGGPQMSRKANQSPRNEIGQRIKTKRET